MNGPPVIGGRTLPVLILVICTTELHMNNSRYPNIEDIDELRRVERTDTIRAYFAVKSLHHFAKDVLPCLLIASIIETNVLSRRLHLPIAFPKKLKLLLERVLMCREPLEIHKA